MCFMWWRFNIQVQFCIENFFHYMVPYGLKNFAIVARAQYNQWCLRPNNYDISSARYIIFAVSVQNIYLCKLSASKPQRSTRCGAGSPRKRDFKQEWPLSRKLHVWIWITPNYRGLAPAFFQELYRLALRILYETPNTFHHFWVGSPRKSDFHESLQYFSPPCTTSVRGWWPPVPGIL